MAVQISGSRTDIERTLRTIGVDLTAEEALRIKSLIGRDPTPTELFIFDIMWSEHCSYKSSKSVLEKYLPTEGKRVVIGPGEDAGVVRLADLDGVSYVLVVAHESHNHPSQILPVEGAATGIGGIVRDVYCMGADVVGVMDGLRFGDPSGEHAETVKEIFQGVITGIWEYGNALGVPNVGGDVFFDKGYDYNCLVNVIAVGVAREEDIIRSRVPGRASAEPYDYILVGKPTDRSGLGGATLASRILDDAVGASIGAVQLHDPFLKRVLTEANKSVLACVRGDGAEIGFKDLGAGGIACAVSELAGAGGFGADVDLASVHVACEAIEPHAIACSETQERYCLVVPSRLSSRILAIYNEDFELPHIYRGARASVIGRVTRNPDLLMRYGQDAVVDVPVEVVNRGIAYQRRAIGRPKAGTEEPEPRITDIRRVCMDVLALTSVASKHYVYRHYDSEVKGCSVLKPGEADACVVCIPGTPIGIATSVDGNPRHSRIDAYGGAAYAVAESLRNLASVGATAVALTDCLNFGSPEDPHVFQDFVDTVRGIGDAARGITAYDTRQAVPIVSGNVSFYNESASGSAIPPSPIIGSYGVLEDYSVALTMCLKHQGNALILVGERKAGLGGSALYACLGRDGLGELPRIDFDVEARAIHIVTEIISAGWALACHDISEGGLFTTVAEMVIGGWGMGAVGAAVDLDPMGGLAVEQLLFGESGGFVLEAGESYVARILGLAERNRVWARVIGRTTREHDLRLAARGEPLVVLGGDEMRLAYWSAVERQTG